jgi:hypothetical protein
LLIADLWRSVVDLPSVIVDRWFQIFDLSSSICNLPSFIFDYRFLIFHLWSWRDVDDCGSLIFWLIHMDNWKVHNSTNTTERLEDVQLSLLPHWRDSLDNTKSAISWSRRCSSLAVEFSVPFGSQRAGLGGSRVDHKTWTGNKLSTPRYIGRKSARSLEGKSMRNLGERNS